MASLPLREGTELATGIWSWISKTPSMRAISSPSEVAWGGPTKKLTNAFFFTLEQAEAVLV